MTDDRSVAPPLPCGYVFSLTGATCLRGPDYTLHRPGSHNATPTTPVHDYAPVERRHGPRDRRTLDAAAPDELRADGEGYEVRTWVRHQPSGVVVLPGHPQLGGRYCKTDGGDWPCAAVRAALRPPGAPEPGE